MTLTAATTLGKHTKMFDEYPEIMTPEQVAEACQFSLEEVTELLLSGEIPARKLGTHWRIPKRALIAFLGIDLTNHSSNGIKPYNAENLALW